MNYSKVPLIKHPEIKDKAREALLDAIDDDWAVAELQPLIYVHIMEVRPYNNTDSGSTEIGFTERLMNILCKAEIVYLLDLVELTTEELLTRTRSRTERGGDGLGVVLYSDLLWALANFDRYDECYERFKKVVMPNPLDEDSDYRGGVNTVYGHGLGE